MWSETRRPERFEGIVGHAPVKDALQTYLQTPPYERVLLLHGPPGIGKTTLALAATRTFGFEALEINASRSLRSFADVESLAQSCQHTRSIGALIRGDTNPMCLVLDEVDGSDPHAQRKLVEWMVGPLRKIPVILTCNEVPRIMKTQTAVSIVRCYPPNAADLAALVPNSAVLAKRFKHDVRRMLQFLQYGDSDSLPSNSAPGECSPEVAHILHQRMWTETDPMELANASAQSSSH